MILLENWTQSVFGIFSASPSYRQIIEILKATAQDLATPGFDLDTGAGLLNVTAAISIAKITKPENYISPEIDIPDNWSGEGIVTPTERATDVSQTLINRLANSIPYAAWRPFAQQSIPLILAEAANQGITNFAQIAYMLATSEHESHAGQLMTELWGPTATQLTYQGRLGNTQPGDGFRYRGRGYVQITGRSNYTNWSQWLDIDLVGQPERATEPSIAAKIIVRGMQNGNFTTKKLSDYINASNQDFYNARRVVNGMVSSQATTVAAIAQRYYNILKSSVIQNPVQPPPIGRRPYSIRSSDTLWGIAQRELGNGNRWREITKDAQGQQPFTDAEAHSLRMNQIIYLPVVREVGIGRPIISNPIIPAPIPVAPGSQSRSPQLFREAYERAGGRIRGWTPTGHAYRWGNGWTQEFRDPSGDRMLLMLEDDADKAYIMWGGNLMEYEFMGGPVGRDLDGRGVFLGYPMSDENIFSNPRDGQRSVWQQFRGDDGKARIHNLSGFMSVATWGAIGSLYTEMGGAGSFLGMPTRREYIDGDTIWADFQGGRIAYSRNDGRTEALHPGEQPSWRQVAAILNRFGDLSTSERQQIEAGFHFPASYGNRYAQVAVSNNPKRWLGESGQRARYIQDADMPVVADPRYRSPDQIRQVINYFNVADPNNARYTADRRNTFCNIFATDVMRALRAPLPHWVGTRELDANATFDWLNNPANGWRRVSSAEAAEATGRGTPALASWKNPGGIGHIAVVRPPEPGDNPNNPRIAQAGATNFVNDTVSKGFGNRAVSYFVYG